MSEQMSAGASAVVSELDELVDYLAGSRAREAAAFAAEMFFFARVAGLVERREAERAVQAGKEAFTSSSQLAMREVYAEIGAALQLSEWQVARKVSLAWSLTGRFIETLYETGDGRLSPQHATTIADVGAEIDDDAVRAEYETVALDMAREMTPSQLKAALSGLVVRLDPVGTEQRVREAVKRRKVSLRELEPGLARLTVDVPTAQGVAAVNRVETMATELFKDNRAEKAEHEAAQPTAERAGEAADEPVFDERTVPQIMADMFCDLVLTNSLSGHGASDEARAELSEIRGRVQVSVPVTTLAGTSVGGAVVEGVGPIDDDTARALAASAPGWVRVAVDPMSGVPMCVDRYRPVERQKLFLQVRDERCRFPGCRRPARRCDIDHTIAAAEGGPTCLCNLEHLCERHHTLKHHTDWSVEQLSGGILRWIAPTGRIRITRPPGTVRFDPVALIDPDPHVRHLREQQRRRDPAPF